MSLRPGRGWFVPFFTIILACLWEEHVEAYRHEGMPSRPQQAHEDDHNRTARRTWSETVGGTSFKMEELEEPVVVKMTPEEWMNEFHHGPQWHHVEENHLKHISRSWEEEEDKRRSEAAATQASSFGENVAGARNRSEGSTTWFPDAVKKSNWLSTSISFSYTIPAIWLPIKVTILVKGTVSQKLVTKCYAWDVSTAATLCIGWMWPFKICGSIGISLEVAESSLASQEDNLEFETPVGFDITKCHSSSAWTVLRDGIVVAARAWWRYAVLQKQNSEVAGFKKAQKERDEKGKAFGKVLDIMTYGTLSLHGQNSIKHSDFKDLMTAQVQWYTISGDWFETALYAYWTDQIKPLIEADGDVGKTWESMYTSSDGRWMHRYMSPTDQISADSQDKHHGVLLFKKVKELSQWASTEEDKLQFKYNTALSVANFFVRFVKDIEALFQLFFAAHPGWDGDCSTLPYNWDHSEANKAAEDWDWAAAAAAKSSKGKEPKDFLTDVLKKFSTVAKCGSASKCSGYAACSKKECRNCPQCQMSPVLWCTVAEEYFTQDTAAFLSEKVDDFDTAMDEYITFRDAYIPNEGSIPKVPVSKPAQTMSNVVERNLGFIARKNQGRGARKYIDPLDGDEDDDISDPFGSDYLSWYSKYKAQNVIEDEETCGGIVARQDNKRRFTLCMVNIPDELVALQGSETNFLSNVFSSEDLGNWSREGPEIACLGDPKADKCQADKRMLNLTKTVAAITGDGKLTGEIDRNFKELDSLISDGWEEAASIFGRSICDEKFCGRKGRHCEELSCSLCYECGHTVEDRLEVSSNEQMTPKVKLIRQMQFAKQAAVRVPDTLSKFRDQRVALHNLWEDLPKKFDALRLATKDLRKATDADDQKVQILASKRDARDKAWDELTTLLVEYRETIAMVQHISTNLQKWLPGLPEEAPYAKDIPGVDRDEADFKLVIDTIESRIQYSGYLLDMHISACDYVAAAFQTIDVVLRGKFVATDEAKSTRATTLMTIANHLDMKDDVETQVVFNFEEACMIPIDADIWSDPQRPASRRPECERADLSQGFVAMFPTFVLKALLVKEDMAAYLEKLPAFLGSKNGETAGGRAIYEGDEVGHPMEVMLAKLANFAKEVFGISRYTTYLDGPSILKDDLQTALKWSDKPGQESLWTRLADARVKLEMQSDALTKSLDEADLSRLLLKKAKKRKETARIKPIQVPAKKDSECACRDSWSKRASDWKLHRYRGCSVNDINYKIGGKVPKFFCRAEPWRDAGKKSKCKSNKAIIECDVETLLTIPSSFPIYMKIGSTRTPVQLPLYTADISVKLSLSLPKSDNAADDYFGGIQTFGVSTSFKMNTQSWTAWKADFAYCGNAVFGISKFGFDLQLCLYRQWLDDLSSSETALGLQAKVIYDAGTLKSLQAWSNNWVSRVADCADEPPKKQKTCWADIDDVTLLYLQKKDFFDNLMTKASDTVEKSLISKQSAAKGLALAGGAARNIVQTLGENLGEGLWDLLGESETWAKAFSATAGGVVNKMADVVDVSGFSLRPNLKLSKPTSKLNLKWEVKVTRTTKDRAYEDGKKKSGCKQAYKTWWCLSGFDFSEMKLEAAVNKPVTGGVSGGGLTVQAFGVGVGFDFNFGGAYTWDMTAFVTWAWAKATR